jgi:hypothetical protein
VLRVPTTVPMRCRAGVHVLRRRGSAVLGPPALCLPRLASTDRTEPDPGHASSFSAIRLLTPIPPSAL